MTSLKRQNHFTEQHELNRNDRITSQNNTNAKTNRITTQNNINVIKTEANSFVPEGLATSVLLVS